MEILDQESGEEEPDFLGLVREEEKLREIIRVHAGNDRKYFDWKKVFENLAAVQTLKCPLKHQPVLTL